MELGRAKARASLKLEKPKPESKVKDEVEELETAIAYDGLLERGEVLD